jgi:hypothetical protein
MNLGMNLAMAYFKALFRHVLEGCEKNNEKLQSSGRHCDRQTTARPVSRPDTAWTRNPQLDWNSNYQLDMQDPAQ